MKVFAICGPSGSGKTETVERVVATLLKRGYSAGSVKDIHDEGFAMDTPGTDTYRHRTAGAEPVTARGLLETAVLFPKQLSLDAIFRFYNRDYVVVEGGSQAPLPKILCAHSKEEIDERLDNFVFCISGVVSNEIDRYGELPVVNAIREPDKLVSLIEERVPDSLAGSEVEHSVGVELRIGGRVIPLMPFVQSIIGGALVGMVSELKGYRDGQDIEVKIKYPR